MKIDRLFTFLRRQVAADRPSREMLEKHCLVSLAKTPDLRKICKLIADHISLSPRQNPYAQPYAAFSSKVSPKRHSRLETTIDIVRKRLALCGSPRDCAEAPEIVRNRPTGLRCTAHTQLKTIACDVFGVCQFANCGGIQLAVANSILKTELAALA